MISISQELVYIYLLGAKTRRVKRFALGSFPIYLSNDFFKNGKTISNMIYISQELVYLYAHKFFHNFLEIV